jgi:arabinogalactan oligomer/maltooligosaccharide transport system substrate-binding protein
MKQKRPFLILASLGTLLMLLLSACGGTSSTTGTTPTASAPVTITYWYTEDTGETPVIQQLIQQFQLQNPNIKVNAQYVPFGQTQAKFSTAAQSNTAPDVLRSDVGWVTQFASLKYLLPIDSMVANNNMSDYLSAPVNYDKYNGHLYGLPQVTDFLALMYNKAILAKAGITTPPATMADFEADAMKIQQSKAAKYAFETSGASYFTLPFLYAYGGGMIDPSGKIIVNSPGSIAGLSFLLKLQNQDKVMPAKVDFANGYNNMTNDFKTGTTAMIFQGPWQAADIQTGSAFTDKTNLGIAGIPTGPTGVTGSPVGGQSYVIYAGSQHPNEAYKFISFMSSSGSQITIAKANHTLPTRSSTYQDPAVTADPVIAAYYAIRSTGVNRPIIPQGGQLFTAFDPNVQATLAGAKTPTDALNAVAASWQTLLSTS